MLENEIKALINKQEFERLKVYLSDKCSVHKSFIQINYYYDNEDHYLSKNKNTLRIRQIEGQLKIEYKFKKVIINEVRTSQEYSKFISDMPIAINIFDEFGIDDNNFYKYIGNLITERSNYYMGEVVISLDKNYYLGKIDYEMEIEGNNSENVKKIYNRFDIPNSSLFYPGKFSRYCKALNEFANN